MAKPTIVTTAPYTEDPDGAALLRSIFNPGPIFEIVPVRIIKDYYPALELDLWTVLAHYRTEDDVKRYIKHITKGLDNPTMITYALEPHTNLATITLFSNN